MEKRKSPYDITPQEMLYAEIGREISKYAENQKTTSLRFSRKQFETDRKGSAEDDVWNHMLSACDKLTRIGTLWGPQDTSCLNEKERIIVKAQLRKRENDRKRRERVEGRKSSIKE
tara:strand:+ start:246 stop:593 length:348 start_codon:yes stop_codon:yes gene_type:complete